MKKRHHFIKTARGRHIASACILLAGCLFIILAIKVAVITTAIGVW